MKFLIAGVFFVVSFALPPCKTDLDCSLNGVCNTQTGVCACDKPWIGNIDGSNTLPDCGFLDFLPSPVSSCGPACVFHGGPSSVDTSWTSWGISVLSADDGLYHGMVAEMANECGLGAWTKGSQVIHTNSSSPTGPFLRVAGDPVVPPWSHNPQQILAPDGTHVIFTLGDGWAQNGAPQNCTKQGAKEELSMAPTEGFPPLKGLGNCTRLTTPANCNPNPCWSCNVTLHTSKDLNAEGPWTPHTTQLIGLSNYDNIGNWWVMFWEIHSRSLKHALKKHSLELTQPFLCPGTPRPWFFLTALSLS